eukprot:gene4103-14204_t
MLGRDKLVHRIHDPGTNILAANSRQRRGPGLHLRSPRSPRPRYRSTWVWVLAVAVFTAICVFATITFVPKLLRNHRHSYRRHHLPPNHGIEHHKLTLQFEVCNGMSNQRLSVLYGIIIATELGRVPVIPGFLLSGVQWTAANTLSNDSVPMEELYDVPLFEQSLDSVGIEVMHPSKVPPASSVTRVDISKARDPIELLSTYRGQKHVSIGCPLFKVPAYFFNGANSRVMWAALDGLRPNKMMSKPVNTIVNKMKSLSPNKRYNYVHLRIEQDWILHCKRWEQIQDGHIRNNCDDNTQVIDEVLVNLKVDNADPIYIASFWEQVDPQMEKVVLDGLEAKGYTVLSSRNFTVQLSKDRELADQGMLSQASLQTERDYLIQAAVNSAMRHHTIKPFCIWTGNTSAPIFQWLADKGVTFIFHSPSWGSALWSKAQSKDLSLVSAFVRMDLLLIPELEQYIYVLYTEPDVYFPKKVTITSFSLPLPEYFGLAFDPDSPGNVDGGVMLVDLPAARRTYPKLKDFVLSSPDAPYFSGGAGMVSAYVEFYWESVPSDVLNGAFAAKPFREHDDQAFVVHWQGPKPHEYYSYLQEGVCPRSQTVCRQAFETGLCFYVKKWRAFINDSHPLWYSCVLLFAPHLQGMCVQDVVSSTSSEEAI